MSNTATIFGLLVMFGFLILVFGNIAIHNPQAPEDCKKIIEKIEQREEQPKDYLSITAEYIFTSLVLLFTECSVIPAWAIGMIFLAVIIVIVLWALPFTGG